MKKLKIISLIIVINIVIFATMEITCRLLHLTEHFDADFKFYIRHVDGDVADPNNIEDALLMWSPRPNYRGVNSQGFHGKEHSIKKPKNTTRILCLGDSSTFWGSYPRMLEEKLNKDFGPNDRNFEVINAGVTGYTSYQGLCMYKYKGAKYKPDIVTFYFGVNDPVTRFYLNDKEILQDGVPVFLKKIKDYFLLNSHLYRLLRKPVFNLIGKEKYHNSKKVPRVSIENYRKNIIQLYELSKKDGFLLVLVSPPLCKERMSIWANKGDNNNRGEYIVLYRKALEAVAGEYNIPLIEIEEMTEKSAFPTTGYFSDTVHPNKAGYEIITQHLYDYIVSEIL